MKAEKLYRVIVPTGFILAKYGNEQELIFVDEASIDLSEPWEFNFTEEEIKKTDPNLMLLAVEVAE